MKRELVWRKSSRSGSSGGQCIELTAMGHMVAIRDSKDPQGTMLVVRPAELREAIHRAGG